MAKKEYIIRSGPFMDTLKKYASEETKPMLLRYSADDRKTLDREAVIALVNDSGKTIAELFEEAGLPVGLSEKDSEYLSALRSMKKESMETIVEITDGLVDKEWWLEHLMEKNKSNYDRFREVYRKKNPAFGRDEERDKREMPTIFSLGKINVLPCFDVESIPGATRELDIAMPLIFDIPMEKAAYYDNDKKIDMAFAKYKLLSASMREIVLEVAKDLAQTETR